jgi:hypothetical protein
MIHKLRGTLTIAAIILIATGSVVAQVWFQAANAQITPAQQQALRSLVETGYGLIVGKAKLLFGVDLPLGQESPTFIQNVTQLAKEGFDSPQNAKLFLQLDSIALNSSSSHPGNVTLTAPTINHIISVYNQMKKNNSTGGFTEIATVAMQALNPVSGFDAGGRLITVLPNSLDFGDILKFGTLAAGFGCATGPNSGDFSHIVGWNVKAGPCIGSALGAAVVRLIWKN